MTALLVALGAAVGAPLRYLVDQLLRRRFGDRVGTLVVNVVGSALLGGLAGASASVSALLGVGFCGALTTYSAFGLHTVTLIEERVYLTALGYSATGIVSGLAAAALGHALA